MNKYTQIQFHMKSGKVIPAELAQTPAQIGEFLNAHRRSRDPVMMIANPNGSGFSYIITSEIEYVMVIGHNQEDD